MIAAGVFLSLVAIMFESGQFYETDPVTGQERLNSDSEGFYTTLLVLAALVLIGSMVYYAIVLLAEGFGHVPSWVRKFCISRKSRRLGSHRFSMDSEIEMHHNPGVGGEDPDLAIDLRKAELERAQAAKRAEELTKAQAELAAEARRLKQEGAMRNLNSGNAARATPRRKKDKRSFQPQIVGESV